MIILLAALGLIVAVRQAYLHYVKYQQLKAENACLRQHWKDDLRKKP